MLCTAWQQSLVEYETNLATGVQPLPFNLTKIHLLLMWKTVFHLLTQSACYRTNFRRVQRVLSVDGVRVSERAVLFIGEGYRSFRHEEFHNFGCK